MQVKPRIVLLLVLLGVAAIALVVVVSNRREEIHRTEAEGMERVRQHAIESHEKEERRARADATPAPKPVAGVNPDCYGDGYTCDRARVHDAEQLATVLEPTLRKAGWPLECFTVQYIGGDAGEKDAISVTVRGESGGGTIHCDEDPPPKPSRKDVTRAAKNVKTVLTEHGALIRDVDLLQVTDGADLEVQLPIP